MPLRLPSLRSAMWRAVLPAIAAIAFIAPTEGCSARKQPGRDAGAAGPSVAIAPSPAPTAASEAPPPPAGAATTFEATVRPILATRCAPCHNPGGKMYGRLPFDQPAIVSSHAAGVRRRLKDHDLQAFERWLATLPGPSS